MRLTKWLTRLVICIIGALHYWETSCYHAVLEGLSIPEQKVVSLKTEAAFYYSYYEEVVLAPTLSDAFARVLADRRSEAPDLINALQRFNIYQEFLTGLAYRFFIWVVGNSFAPSSWHFYRWCSFVSQGFGHVCLAALAAAFGGGGFFGGLLPSLSLACWSLVHRRDMSRIHDLGMLPLRENWAAPWFFCQVLCLHRLLTTSPELLAPGMDASRRNFYIWWLWGFRLSTVVCIILWQFSAFAFMLQVAAVFACVLVFPTAGPRRVLRTVVTSMLACVAVSAALLFGNDLLVHHMLVTECVTILLVLWLRDKPPRRRVFFWCDGALAVLFFALIRLVQSPWATADEHVSEIMMGKMRQLFPDWVGETSKEPTFNARLYFAVSVFDFISWDAISRGIPTLVYHFGGLGALLCAVAFGRQIAFHPRGKPIEGPNNSEPAENETNAPAAISKDGLRRRRDSKNNASSAKNCASKPTLSENGLGEENLFTKAVHGYGEEWLANAFGNGTFLVELILFCALGCFIQRLKILCAPLLCCLAAASLGPGLVGAVIPSVRDGSRTNCRVLIRSLIICFVCSAQFWQVAFLIKQLPFSERVLSSAHDSWVWSDGERAELYEWIGAWLPTDAIVVSSMPLSAELRLNTPVRLVIHPQFESRSLRDKVQELYVFYMCTPDEEVAAVMRKYGSKHIILEYKRCDFSPFFLDNRSDLNCKQGQRPWHDIFCPAAHVSPHFNLRFANAGYAVFELASSVQQVPMRPALKINDIRVWKPMLETCLSQEGDICLSRTAELAAMFGDKLRKPDISQTLFEWVLEHGSENGYVQFIIGHNKDFSLKRTREAGQHYKRAVELLPNSQTALKEYLMWLDLEAKDQNSIKSLIFPRKTGGRSQLSILDIGDVSLACEAAVTAKDFGDRVWSSELWSFAVNHNIGSRCVQNNWPIFHDGQDMKATLGTWEMLRNIFWFRRLKSDLGSMVSAGIRFEPPRRQWNFSLEASF